MLRLARLTDYGLVLMTRIAAEPALRVFSTRELAEATRVPVPTASKVLKLLAQAGLVESHRGVAGGYSLARPPSAISVADVVAAIEGPVALTLCSEETGRCDIESFCPERGHMQRINDVIAGALSSVKLSEMVPPRAGTAIPVRARRTEGGA